MYSNIKSVGCCRIFNLSVSCLCMHEYFIHLLLRFKCQQSRVGPTHSKKLPTRVRMCTQIVRFTARITSGDSSEQTFYTVDT